MLRKTYPKRLLRSMLVLVVSSTLLILSLVVEGNVSKKNASDEPKEVKLTDIEDIPQDIPPPPPPPPEEAPKVEMKKYTEVNITDKKNLRPEELQPEINLDDLEDAVIGTVNQEGIKSTDLKPPPPSSLGGDGDDDFVFSKVEVNPQPPGGKDGFKRWLARELNASVASDNGAPPGRYTIPVRFVVGKDGSISRITTIGKKHGYGMEEEALRVMRKCPPFRPGEQNGRPVTVWFVQRITFLVESD